MVHLSERIIKDKEEANRELLYIDERFLKTPAVAIEQALKELYEMAILARQNLDQSFHALIHEDTSEKKQLQEVEDRIDYLTNELTRYFIRISAATQSNADEELIGGLHHVVNDIERLGDYSMLLFKETNDMKKKELYFSEETKEELEQIYTLISNMFDLGFETLSTREIDNFQKIANVQKEIKHLISKTRKEHVVRLNSKVYPAALSKNIYSVLISLQRVSEHFLNISFSIRSTTGDEEEALQAFELETNVIS